MAATSAAPEKLSGNQIRGGSMPELAGISLRGPRSMRELVRSNPREVPRRTATVACPGVAGNDAGEELGGSQSSG